MKRFCLLLIPLLLLPLTAFAQDESKIAVETTFDVTDGDGVASSATETLYYNLVTDDDGNVTASVTSPADGADAYSGVISIPATITYNEVTYDVTAIESGAFSGCGELTSLTIGENITSMGEGAVAGCSGLTHLTYNATNCTDTGDSDKPSIANCDNLVTLDIGENVEWLAQDVFYGCTAVKTLNYNAKTISTGVDTEQERYRGDGVFRNCTSVETINIGESVEKMNDFLFAMCTALKTVNFNAIECTQAGNSINAYGTIFWGCANLEEVNIGENVTVIPDWIFYSATYTNNYNDTVDPGTNGFPNFKKLTIPANVKEIGYSAFYGCTGISDLTIAEGIEKIDSHAFYGCTSLTEVTIPTTVSKLVEYAFSASGLVTVNYDAAAATSNTTYSYNYYLHSPFEDCDRLTTVNIGKDVTSLFPDLFAYCTSITTINYNAVNCTYAGEDGQQGVFRGCTGVTTINVLEDVTYIPAFVFQGCTGVKTVNFNAKECKEVGTSQFTSSLGNKTYTDYTPFYDCSYIETVTIGSEVTIIPAYLFYGYVSPSWGNDSHDYGDKYFPYFTTLVVPSNVKEIGDYAFAYCQSLGAETDSGSGSVTLESGIETIGSYVFESCSALKEIVVPNSVTSMGIYVFQSCSSLVSATLSEYVNSVPIGTFYSCTSLPTITIPEIVVTIGNYAFYNCKALGPSLTIPQNVTSIGDYAFYQCTSLEKVPMDDALLTIGSLAFYQCTSLADVTLDDALQTIGNYAFYQCTSLKEIAIPDKVTYIGGGAFQYCSALKSIEIPNATEEVGSYAFESCTALEKAVIGEGVTKLESFAFRYCTALDSVAYNAIQSDYTYSPTIFPFYGCNNIRKFTFGEKVEKIPDYLLYGANCDSLKLLTELTIPESVTYLGNYAFYILNGLKTLHYNAKNSATTTNNMPVFIGCVNLETVVFGDSVESIPMYLLMGNNNNKFPYLRELTIPESVTNIGYEAIYYCDSLKTLTYNAINCGATLANPSVASSTTPMILSCNGLKRLNMGAKVESIPALAFYSCTTLEEVYSYNPTPPTCWGYDSPGPSFPVTTAFLSSCWLIDPEDSNAAYYKSTIWEDFTHSREMTVSVTPNAYNSETGKYYATRFSPYSYTLEKGLLGGVVTGLTETDSGKSVHIDWIYDGNDEEANVIPAGTAIMVRSDSNDEYVNETIATEDEVADEDENAEEGTEDNNDSGSVESDEGEITMPDNWLRGNTLDGKEYYNYYATEDATTLTERVFQTYVTNYDEDGLTADVDKYYFYKFTFGNQGSEYEDVLGFYWADADTQTYNNKDGAQFEMSTGKHAWLAIPKTMFDDGLIENDGRLTLGDFDDYSGSEPGNSTQPEGNLEIGGEGNETDGITSLAADSDTNAVIYNMAGQRVNDMSRRGIYIVNGRKVVRK